MDFVYYSKLKNYTYTQGLRINYFYRGLFSTSRFRQPTIA